MDEKQSGKSEQIKAQTSTQTITHQKEQTGAIASGVWEAEAGAEGCVSRFQIGRWDN